MKLWKVFALRAGCSRIDQSMATYLEGAGDPLVIPHTMFALLGPRVTVVDTSFESPDAVNDAYPQPIWRSAEEHPTKLLAEVGVDPKEVEFVICTHLHYDHCGCNSLFENARVVAQRAELEYAMAPTAKLMEREFFSPSGGFDPPFARTELELVDGDFELADGLSLITVPGHTPGSQAVLVDTGGGEPLALAGDLIMVQENFDDEVPVGLHTDLDAWYRSVRKLKQLTDRVVPSHDLRVFASDPIREVA